MRAVWSIGVSVLLGSLAAPALADTSRASADAIFVSETCLRLGDAAFEQSLPEGLSEADLVALVAAYSAATFECLGLAMEICEGQDGDQDGGQTCLEDLEQWVREERERIVALLPETIPGATQARYARRVARAGADADGGQCNEMTDDQRTRYCGVVAEGIALEDAYGAWRLARRAGVVPLEGHDPVDLELLR